MKNGGLVDDHVELELWRLVVTVNEPPQFQLLDTASPCDELALPASSVRSGGLSNGRVVWNGNSARIFR